MRHYIVLVISLTLCLTFIPSPVPTYGQDSEYSNHGTGNTKDPYIVPKSESEISVDAVLDEEAWKKALVLELKYEVRPGENVPPPVRTESAALSLELKASQQAY